MPLFSKGPFFDVEEKPKSKRRLNSSRINELSKETRRHKLSKDLIGLPMRLMNSKPPKELPLDKEEIRRNYKQWIEKHYSSMRSREESVSEEELKNRKDIFWLSKTCKTEASNL